MKYSSTMRENMNSVMAGLETDAAVHADRGRNDQPGSGKNSWVLPPDNF